MDHESSLSLCENDLRAVYDIIFGGATALMLRLTHTGTQPEEARPPIRTPPRQSCLHSVRAAVNIQRKTCNAKHAGWTMIRMRGR